MAAAHTHDHDHSAEDTTDQSLAETLDLDGVVLRAYWEQAIAAVVHAADVGPQARVVDLGAGTGTGTFALARQLTDAQVVAVDSSPDMLQRIAAKAAYLGLAGRIRTVQADLDSSWPEVGPVDITWASMSLHHLTDPRPVLAHVLDSTRPGGILAVAEFDEPLRFLPDDVGVGRPGVERRCLDALRVLHSEAVPHLGSDWASQLTAAGFQVIEHRAFHLALDPPLPAGAGDYAAGWLARMVPALTDVLAAEDLAAFDVLLDPADPRSVHHSENLMLRGTRTLTLARRP